MEDKNWIIIGKRVSIDSHHLRRVGHFCYADKNYFILATHAGTISTRDSRFKPLIIELEKYNILLHPNSRDKDGTTPVLCISRKDFLEALANKHVGEFNCMTTSVLEKDLDAILESQALPCTYSTVIKITPGYINQLKSIENYGVF